MDALFVLGILVAPIVGAVLLFLWFFDAVLGDK